MDYNDLSKEELLGLLNNPDEIETGCENNCDVCLEEALSQIREILVDKYSMKRKELV